MVRSFMLLERLPIVPAIVASVLAALPLARASDMNVTEAKVKQIEVDYFFDDRADLHFDIPIDLHDKMCSALTCYKCVNDDIPADYPRSYQAVASVFVTDP